MTIISQKISDRQHEWLYYHDEKLRNYYIGGSASIDEIKSQFQEFKGGSVDLIKVRLVMV